MKLTSKSLKGPFFTYALGEQIGSGGGGHVFEARRDDELEVAIKVLNPKHPREKLRRFRNELGFGLRNTDPRLVTVLDFGSAETDEGDAPFYVMPRFKGTLRSRMEAGVTFAQAHALAIALFDALEAAHHFQVIHRDVKPENLLWNGHDDQLVLSDFGAAHFHEDDLVTHVETAPGTRLANFEYAAPEQRRKGPSVDKRCDIYAAGLILHELFTGVVPHGSGYELIATRTPEFAYFDDIVTWMIQHSPSARPDSVDAIRVRLRALQKEAGVRQKLSELEKKVIPLADTDDPLVADPPRVVGADIRGTVLTLQLSRSVTSQWISVFQNCNFGSSLMGAGPEAFRFSGTSATLAFSYNQPTTDNVQRVVDDFKRFIQITTREYDERLKREKRQAIDAAERENARAIEEERKRLDILRSLRI